MGRAGQGRALTMPPLPITAFCGSCSLQGLTSLGPHPPVPPLQGMLTCAVSSSGTQNQTCRATKWFS